MLRVFRRLAASSPDAVARRATNDERFGPSSEELSELVSLTFKPKACDKIMQVVEHRFRQNKRHWRQKLKSLTVLQYFVVHGSPQCLEWMSQHESAIAALTEFSYLDQHNVDQGRSVRDKAHTVLEYVRSPEKVSQAKLEYQRQRETVRKSIGTGRPSTTSRNTLEMLRDNILLDNEELPALPTETDRGLGVIEEER